MFGRRWGLTTVDGFGPDISHHVSQVIHMLANRVCAVAVISR